MYLGRASIISGSPGPQTGKVPARKKVRSSPYQHSRRMLRSEQMRRGYSRPAGGLDLGRTRRLGSGGGRRAGQRAAVLENSTGPNNAAKALDLGTIQMGGGWRNKNTKNSAEAILDATNRESCVTQAPCPRKRYAPRGRGESASFRQDYSAWKSAGTVIPGEEGNWTWRVPAGSRTAQGARERRDKKRLG